MIQLNIRRTALALMLAFAATSSLHAETLKSVRARIATASATIHDLRGRMVVHPANRSDAKEINKGIIEALDKGLRDARIVYARPDKFRAEGKAQGVDVTYVLNGNTNQFLAPALMLKKTDDLSDKRIRKRSTLDLGFASDSLWIDYNVKLLPSSGNIIKLRLVAKGTHDKRYDLVTLDSKTLKVLTKLRYDGGGKLKTRNVFMNHKTLGKMPVATMVKVYSGDGGYAGSIELKDICVNSRVSPGLFAIK